MGSFILPRENRAYLQFMLDIVSSVRGTPGAALQLATKLAGQDNPSTNYRHLCDAN
jgi:hypothetical protein